jgi:hypothetical protein
MMGSGTGEQERHEVEEELDGLGKSAEAAIGAEEGVTFGVSTSDVDLQ